MLPSVRAFFTGILDYAGLFPPAKLPLDEAIRRYARYRTEAESWMLGRFVCPVERLSELGVYADNLLQQGGPYSFAVLVDANAFAAGHGAQQLSPGWAALRDFRKAHGSRVAVNAIEVRVPDAFVSAARAATKRPLLVAFTDTLFGQPGLPLVTVFCEYETALEASRVDELIDYLAQEPLDRYGFKLRCGGLHASTFPSVDQVAHIITACCAAGVPLKFTAGLHHPVRHYDTGVQTHMHGFLNVFGAGVLAHARRLSEEQVREIVADEDIGNFTFAERGFAWKDVSAGAEEISAARQQGVISFGSCSFEEPRDDLRKLGLL